MGESKQHVRATMQLQMMHCQSIFVTSLVIVVVSLLTDWGRNVGKRGNKIFSQTFQRNVEIRFTDISTNAWSADWVKIDVDNLVYQCGIDQWIAGDNDYTYTFDCKKKRRIQVAPIVEVRGNPIS